MKLLPTLLLMVATAGAHCRYHVEYLAKNASIGSRMTAADPADRFPKLIVNGVAEEKEWASVRRTKNYQDNHGVTDVNGVDIRCFQDKPGTSTATVAAGDQLGFVALSAVTHFGPVSFYMARVPEGKDINTWDGAGNVWFKVGEISAVPGGGAALTSGEATWPAYSMSLSLHPILRPTR